MRDTISMKLPQGHTIESWNALAGEQKTIVGLRAENERLWGLLDELKVPLADYREMLIEGEYSTSGLDALLERMER